MTVWLEITVFVWSRSRTSCATCNKNYYCKYVSITLPLQELQVRCAEGQALLNAAVRAREEVIPWGMPQIEDRALESIRQDWQVYQHNLSEARSQLNATVSRLRLMEKKFQKVNDWITELEEKVAVRTGRQSGRATKEMQLQQMKVENIVKEFLKQNTMWIFHFNANCQNFRKPCNKFWVYSPILLIKLGYTNVEIAWGDREFVCLVKCIETLQILKWERVTQ